MGCRGPRSVHTHSWGTVVLPPLAAFFSPQTRAGGSSVKGALPQGALWPRPHAAPQPPVPSVARGLSLERRGEISQGACALAPACLGSTAPRGPPTPRHATSGKHGGRALTLLGRASRPSGTPRCAVPGGRTPSLRSSDGTERSSGLGAGDRGHGHGVTWRLDTEVIRFRSRAS